MISIAKTIYDSLFEIPEYKILIIGMDGAGKTTLLNKLKQLAKQDYLEQDRITKTIGLNLSYIDYQTNQYYGDQQWFSMNFWSKKYKVLYWDVGGTETSRCIWKKFYSECHGIVFVIDTYQLKNRRQELIDCFNEFINDQLHDEVPLLILINLKGIYQDDVDIQDLLKLCHNKVRDINFQFIDINKNQNVIESIKILHNNIEKLFQYYN